jgi:hypothetical protein
MVWTYCGAALLSILVVVSCGPTGVGASGIPTGTNPATIEGVGGGDTAAPQDGIVSLPRSRPYRPWAGPLVVLVASALGVVLVIGFCPRESRRAALGILAASALLRVITPVAFLHVDGDDVAFVAQVRGAPPSLSSSNSSSFSWTALALWRAFFVIGGDAAQSAFLPARFFGTLLPVVVLLFAWTWTRDRRVALWAGLLSLLYPPLIAYGASTSLELPAVTLFGFAMVLGLESVRRGVPSMVMAAIAAAALLAFAVTLKEEFPVLLVMALLLVLGHAHPASWSRRWLWALAVTGMVVVVASLASWGGFASLVAGRARRMDPLRIALYLLLGVMLLHPPGPPLIWAFFRDVIHPIRTGSRPLHAVVLASVGVYASAIMWTGFNHFRYALVSMIPLMTVIAPVVAGWWDERKVARSARLALRTTAIAQLVFLSAWLLQRYEPRDRDITFLSRHPPGPGALVVFADHGQDRSPAMALAAVGGFDAVALPRLWPTACRPSVDAERVRLRTSYKDLITIAGSYESRFRDLPALGRDREWLRSVPLSEALERYRRELEDRAAAVDARDDPVRCAQGVGAMRTALSRYDRILLFRDAESSSPRGTDLLPILILPHDWQTAMVKRYGEMIDVALAVMKVDRGPADEEIGWYEVESISDPVTAASPPVWRRHHSG